MTTSEYLSALDRFNLEHFFSISQDKDDKEMVECALKLIRKEDDIELEKLLQIKPSIGQCRDNMDRTPIHYAASRNRMITLQALLDTGPINLNIQDKDGETPLHLAINKHALDATKFLLENGADLRLKNNIGNTPLHNAVAKNDIPIIKLILEKSKNTLDLTLLGENGRTCLHIAAIHNHHESAKLLLSASKIYLLNKRCDNGYTPLHEAARGAAAETLELLIKWGVKMEHTKSEMMAYVDREGNISLHSAIHGGNLKCILLCLESGARMIAQQSDLSTALHLACSMGQLDIVSLMFNMQPEDKEQCLSMRDAQKMMPLHYAAMFDHTRVVEFLLKEGANINALDAERRSALLLAASRSAWNSVRIFLNSGADVNVRDSSSRNILHYIVMNGGSLEEISTKLEKNYLCLLLNEKDTFGCTPLHYASRSGKLRSTESLLRLGAIVNPKNNLNESPLHFAAKYGRYNTVNKLINGKMGPAIINEVDNNGKTSLHIAAENGHKKVVRLLLSKGALLQKDHKGRTPLHLASFNGYTETMQLILTVHALLLDQEDKDGNTALHLAAIKNQVSAITYLLNVDCRILHNNKHQTAMDLILMYKHSEAAMAMATHEERGYEILRMNCEKAEGVIQALISLMPEVYVAVLDRCITKSDLNQDCEDYFVKYSFKYLQFSRQMSKQMESKIKNYKSLPLPAMNTMVQYKRLELLCHPVCQKYIQMKWKAYGMYFHMANLLFYVIFMAVLTLFAALLMDVVIQITPKIYDNNTAILRDFEYFPKLMPSSAPFYVNAAIIMTFVVMNIAKEVIQLYQQRMKYLTNPLNLFEWLLYILSGVMVYPVFSGILFQDQLACSAVAVFLAWFNFLLYLQRFDRIGIYVVMFLEILKTLIKALLIFSILFIAFALAFYILLSRGNHLGFSNIPISLFRVFSMMLGEFDILGTFVQPYFMSNQTSPSTTLPFPYFSFGFLFLFMITMPILLVNLLIGLAVGDIESVRRNAYLKRLAMQVELHTELERKLPLVLLERVDKIEVIEYPNIPKNTKLFSFFIPLIQKWFGSVYTNSSEKLLEYSEIGQQDDFMYEEIYKQRQKTKQMSVSLDNIYSLVRLIVQKMEIQAESNDWDEGDQQSSECQSIHNKNTKWTSPAFRKKVKTIATLMRRARDPAI